jgi:hypothetical protein
MILSREGRGRKAVNNVVVLALVDELYSVRFRSRYRSWLGSMRRFVAVPNGVVDGHRG